MFTYANHEITLVYQPKYNIRTQAIIGFEVLSRCHTADGESVSIEKYIDSLNKMGLINEFTLLLTSHAISELNRYGFGHLSLSINCFQSQLNNDGFLNNFIKLSHWYKGQVIVELSEKDSNQSDRKTEAMTNLRLNNIHISLDDFGKDNATIFELLTFNYQELKLDKKIIDTIKNKKTSSYVASLVSFSNHNDITLIAEGVENKKDLALLREIGVKYVQGYVFSRPKPIEEFVKVTSDPISIAYSNLNNLKHNGLPFYSKS